MNRKAVLSSILALSMLLAMFAIIPLALADKTDGQWVPASLLAGSGPTTPGQLTTNEAGVIQYRDFLTVRLGGVLTIGGASYRIYSTGIWQASFNPNTKVLVRHDDAILYISANGSPNGFAGNIEAKAIDFNPVTRTFSRAVEHCVLQGFGSFAGQTLMMSYDGPGGPGHSWTGFDLMK